MKISKWIWVPVSIALVAVGIIILHLGNDSPNKQTIQPVSYLMESSTVTRNSPKESSIKQQYAEVESSPVMKAPNGDPPLPAGDPPLPAGDPPLPPLKKGGIRVDAPPLKKGGIRVEAPPVDKERLVGHVKALATERYTETQRDKARKYITHELKASGWVPTLQPFEGGVNILAKRSGTEHEAGTILVAAHYDTVKGSPGADDNATGVATILEIARLLGSRPTPRSLQVVFFDREEEGLRGSLAFTGTQENLIDLRGAIILDMIGFACYTPGCQRYPQGLPVTPATERGDFVGVAGDIEHLPLLNTFGQSSQSGLPPVVAVPIPLKGLATPDVLRSDHASFWYRGIGAVIVSDTANFRTPHYHKPSDKIETLDERFFTGAAQIVTNATAALLENRDNLATQ